ncbi:MAG: uracil-DNA glycosylase [Candidatus Woesearchaeota archaeon]
MSKQVELETLKREIENDLDCPLKESATNMVFGKGNADAEIVFIGEAPGAEEDKQGIPFVGRAGNELDKYLRNIGLTINDVYIANILKYRPPKNRDPSTSEIESHTPYLLKQLRIIKPKVIATLGNYSTKFVLGGWTVKGMKSIKGITTLHGQEHTVTLNSISSKVIPLYHPAAMLYNPKLREAFERDMLIIANILGKDPSTPQTTISSF